MLSRRTLEVVAVVLIISAASVITAVFYSGALTGGKTSTICSGSGCITPVTTTETVTTTTSAPPSTVFSTTTMTSTDTVTVTTTTTETVVNQSGNGSAMRLGFWLQESDVMQHYSPVSFFNAMFLTPPYPSSLEVMIFAIPQDETNGNGCSASTPYVSASISYWGQVAHMADAYPSIRLVYEIAFDPTDGGQGTYGLSCFNTIVQSFAQYPSVYGIGVEGEFTRPASNLTSAEVQTAMGDVNSAGKVFINYYVPETIIPSGGYDIYHTNFPGGDAGGYDQVGTLSQADPHTVGIDSGYYASFNFPGTVTCPIGASAMNSTTAGWNQCVVSTELKTAVGFIPSSARQFLELDGGFDANGYFTGVSGQSTNQLWDNPMLRSWIWNDPNYALNFLLSV